jgi:hypothetical protein
MGQGAQAASHVSNLVFFTHFLCILHSRSRSQQSSLLDALCGKLLSRSSTSRFRPLLSSRHLRKHSTIMEHQCLRQDMINAKVLYAAIESTIYVWNGMAAKMQNETTMVRTLDPSARL